MGKYGISEYPNTFKRQASFPLDQSSVFSSYDEAEEYASSNPIAYQGQIISVNDNNDVKIYVLKTSSTANVNFDLLLLNVNFEYIVGTWSLIPSGNDRSTFAMDINLPVTATSYELCYEIDSSNTSNEVSIGEKYTDINAFFTRLLAKTDTLLLKLFNGSDNILNLKVAPVNANEFLCFGNLILE